MGSDYDREKDPMLRDAGYGPAPYEYRYRPAQPAPASRELREALIEIATTIPAGFSAASKDQYRETQAVRIDEALQMFATPDTLRERLEGLTFDTLRGSLRMAGVTARELSGDRMYEVLPRAIQILASAPTPAVTPPYHEFDASFDKQPAAPVEARADVCVICGKREELHGVNNQCPIDESFSPVFTIAATQPISKTFKEAWDNEGFDEETFIDKSAANSLWQAAERAGMERAAQMVEEYYGLDWIQIAAKIRALARETPAGGQGENHAT